MEEIWPMKGNDRTLSLKLPLALGFVVVGLLCILCSPALASDETIDAFTIADPTGDWGFPSPYGHYPRGPGYIRMSLIFDTLVWKDQNGYVPALAESWQLEDDAYVFNLRKNVTWQDGEPFTAKDVVFTIDYTKEHPYPLVSPKLVKSAKALDDYTVKLYLNGSYAPFIEMVAGALPIIPEHIYKDVANPAEFLNEEALTGTGPFKLVDYDKAQGTYLYEAYDDYYLGAPRVKQLKFVKVSNEMAAAALEKGDVDAATVPPEKAEELEGMGFNVLKGSHDGITKIMVNHRKELFSDARFRQALYYAIDRQALVDTVLRGYGVIASPGLLAPDNDLFNPDVEKYDYDPAETEKIMGELGYAKDGQYFTKDGKPIEMEMLITSTDERAGEMIKQQLEQSGFKISLRSLDSKTRDSLVSEWNFDMALNSHGGMGADPEILSRLIGEGFSFNSARYFENQKLNDLLGREVSEMNPDNRMELVDEIQVVHAQDLPTLPLYYADSFWAYGGVIDMYHTKRGIAMGTPIAQNKLSFVR
ncbi:MAG: putative ABC transporter periplasmic-binding protein [Methanosaeta sp. PtaU1.Bin112]|nr:MAG: putative ABC transporter periplasmic-binding protein [Methanosaeta sp. PtaU1.Bin112]